MDFQLNSDLNFTETGLRGPEQILIDFQLTSNLNSRETALRQLRADSN